MLAAGAQGVPGHSAVPSRQGEIAVLRWLDVAAEMAVVIALLVELGLRLGGGRGAVAGPPPGVACDLLDGGGQRGGVANREEEPGDVVVDHLAVPDVAKPLDANPDFDAFVDLVSKDDRFVVKVTCPERISKIGPPYDDFVPYARRVVEAIPDRVLWGTDWPHPNMRTHMPDDGKLVDMIPKIAVTAEQQRKLLVDNPMRLYWG